MFEIVTKGGPWGHYLEIKCQKKPQFFFHVNITQH